jgi:hypothetical protein
MELEGRFQHAGPPSPRYDTIELSSGVSGITV